MRKLYKYVLNRQQSLMFFKESLEETNLLSIEIIKQITTQKGEFFALLPEEADLKKLHEFSDSILPEMPQQGGSIGSVRGAYTYSTISSLEKELCDYIINEVKNHQFFCVVDNFNEHYSAQYYCELFAKFGRHCDKEIYYLLPPNKISQGILLECLYRSKTFWHALCILTEHQLKVSSEKKICREEMEEICKEARYVVIGAYDGDGYIFWEKTESSAEP